MTAAPTTSPPTTEPPATGTDAAASVRRRRRPLTLQRRLILTVVGIVSLILVLVAVVTSAVLGNVLETGLKQRLDAATNRLSIAAFGSPGQTATEILSQQPFQVGTLLAMETVPGSANGAVLGSDGKVTTLTDDQLTALGESLGAPGAHTVSLSGLGSFSVEAQRVGAMTVVAGLSRDEVTGTITQMLTAIALLTAGGLVLLATATAWTIRAGLSPLRAVAETAGRVSQVPLDQGEVSLEDRVPAELADPRTEVGQVGSALNALLDHVATSLTARQRNEERMRTFVADASHELRTPLASIRGYSELSLRALRQTPEIAAETTGPSLERIQAQSLRMTTLVEDLLLLARLDEGQELVYGSVDLTRMAIEAVGDAQAAGPEHTWLLDVGETPVVVSGDTGRLHQVIANLLANARTHTPAGTTVSMSVQQEDETAVLRVHDDGPGVDPTISDELFERFSRADRSRARNTGGTGLGLSIARAIVEAHAGSIAVRSTPGDTNFEVRLPAHPVETVEAVETSDQ
ncbi:sensor histidine kinase [Microbacterium sp. CJ88]|uniref:sensor histidine kinase n=1 Tax=Microbacterium sp. CJ88 TaxID=3445672 RepID=UPI003F656B20